MQLQGNPELSEKCVDNTWQCHKKRSSPVGGKEHAQRLLWLQKNSPSSNLLRYKESNPLAAIFATFCLNNDSAEQRYNRIEETLLREFECTLPFRNPWLLHFLDSNQGSKVDNEKKLHEILELKKRVYHPQTNQQDNNDNTTRHTIDDKEGDPESKVYSNEMKPTIHW